MSDYGINAVGNNNRAVVFISPEDDKSSVFRDELDENEPTIFDLVENGTPQEIKDFIENNADSSIHLNKKDAKFRTVLQIAVRQRDLEIVKILFSAGCRDPAALKLAAALRLDHIVRFFIDKIFLDNNRSATDQKPYSRQEGNRNVISEKDICILLKAAVDAEDYVRTKKLAAYLRNEFPYSLSRSCNCPMCRKNSQQTSKNILKETSQHLELCHILSSPACIITTDKPLLEALEWAKHLKTMARWHPENKHELLQLAKRSSKLAIDLLATCDDEKDAMFLLKLDENLVISTMKSKCLQIALGDEQKQFIAHPACQHIISKLWLGTDYDRWRKWTRARRILHFLVQILLIPFVFFLYMFKVKFAEDRLKAPLNRFIYAAASYFFFLGNVVANQYGHRTKNWPTASLDVHDVIITIWVAGHIIKIIADCINQREFSYTQQWWSVYDAIMMALFVTGGVTFVIGNGSFSKETANWHLVMMSQGFYSIAITMACLRILQWLLLSSRLGPLVISFSRMTAVLKRFLVLFVIILFSFSIGIYAVYKHFQTDLPEDKKFDTFFGSYRKTLKLLFWAVFGKGEARFATIPDDYQYFVGNVNVTSDFLDAFSVKVGYTLWCLYHVAIVLILLNMLIAVMTNYYQNIQDNADTEWKFACTELKLYYIEKSNQFPPPFNMIALTFRLFKYLYEAVSNSCCCGNTPDDHTDDAKSRERQKMVVKTMIEKYLQEKEFANILEQR